MRIKILGKFIIAYLVIAVIGFVLISTLGSMLVQRRLIASKSLELYNEAITISDDISKGNTSVTSLYSQLSAIASYQQSVIWLLSDDGAIVLDSSSPEIMSEPVRINNFDRVALGTGYYFIGDFFHYFSSEMLSVIVPLSSGPTPSGYLVIHYPMEILNASRESILGTVHVICIAVFLLFLLIVPMILKWVILPLRRITNGAKEFASGNLKHTIGIQSGDEMQYLSETLDFMASELDKSSDYQKAFIANVSHDFRSPLTSIKGYAEAMQDGTIPAELYPKYLGIVISEADRLNKLSQEMLTMEQVNSGSRALNSSVFDINDMIRDTAASFEGVCYSKNILIDLIMEEEHLNVCADFPQIQQVLYNLIDNAIKFSKNNSRIEIETEERLNKAYIYVKDHGIGIAPDEITKIWDRFYKADTSRGKDPRGSGLGLAIVKEIIQNHGQKINVVSTPDVGTEFSFTLPLPE